MICKRYVEEYLIESGLESTILQPTHFMDMFPLHMLCQRRDEESKNSGEEREVEVEFPMMWNPAVEFSFVALDDFGCCCCGSACEREKHFGATYEICGTRVVSYEAVCGVAGEVLGCRVVPRQKGFEEAVDGFVSMVAGKEASELARDGVERMLLYYNRRGIKGNLNVLGWLIGRKAMTFRDWAQGLTRSASR